MTRVTAWHFYRQLARDGYRLSSLAPVELQQGAIIYAVPRGHWSLAVRAVSSICFEDRAPMIVSQSGGSHVVTSHR